MMLMRRPQLPVEAAGTLTSGATGASIIALAAARDTVLTAVNFTSFSLDIACLLFFVFFLMYVFFFLI
jgi:hypothetical protein